MVQRLLCWENREFLEMTIIIANSSGLEPLLRKFGQDSKHDKARSIRALRSACSSPEFQCEA